MKLLLKKQNLLPLAAISVPIIAICIWIATYALVSHSGETVRLRITGYDPRDLLAGHYLRYRVDFGATVACQATGDSDAAGDWCLCLDQWDGKYAQLSWQGSCDVRPDCRQFLRGTCNSSRFEAGIERFYFSEEHQKLLRVVPPESSIIVALSPNGKGVVKNLLVKDEPLAEWILKQ